jgi:uncharacterized cupredoxin-like copper-binding protein
VDDDALGRRSGSGLDHLRGNERRYLPAQLVVIKTELTAEELETIAEGTAVDIEASGELIGTIKATELPVGTTAIASFEMDAGHYALICNVIGHHSAGMFADLNATE